MKTLIFIVRKAVKMIGTYRLLFPGRFFPHILPFTCLLFLFFLIDLPEVKSQSAAFHETGASDGERSMTVRVGEKVPEEFWTWEHLFYIDGDTVRKNLEEYKGKLLVLDFWATWCAICLHQMGKKQKLFSAFPDKVNLLLVNPLVTNDSFSSISEQQEKLSSLSTTPMFTSIIEDSLIQHLFPNHIYPRFVWIGPRGDLIGLTTAPFTSEGNLKGLLGVSEK